MKKRFGLIKAIQLAVYILITIIGLVTIFSDGKLYQMIGADPSIRTLCVLLWLALGVSFAGILWDLSTHSLFKKNLRELDHAVYSDHVAGIANRFSCDALIDKYIDKPLPDGIGCIMLDLTNIREINDRFGHAGGNRAIQDFSDILASASSDLCFVGRNGGSKFMALFEDCGDDKIDRFLSAVTGLIREHNADPDNAPLAFGSGTAISTSDRNIGITQLIALADSRISVQEARNGKA